MIPTIDMKIFLSGHFKLQVSDTPGGPAKRTVEFDNLITDAGLDRLGSSGNGFIPFFALGTGTTTPSPSDVALSSPSSLIGGTLTLSSTPATVPPYVSSATFSRQSTQGQVAGTWTEVGVITAATGGVLFSRALIVDNLGNPTSITVLPTEFLTITYTLRMVIPDVDVISTFNGITFTTRASDVLSSSWTPIVGTDIPSFGSARIQAFSGTIQPITGRPASSLSGVPNSFTPASPYVPGSFENTWSLTFQIAQANGTINSLVFGVGGGSSSAGQRYIFQTGLSMPIVKDNTQTLTFQFKATWGRAV